jgi:hypothetical protein
VVDRRPLEGLAHVALDLGHQPPHVQRQVQVPRVLRGDNEPELALLIEPRLLERRTGDFTARAVEEPGPSVALDAIALDVPEMKRGGRGSTAPQCDVPRLNDDPAGLRRGGARSNPTSGAPHAAAAAVVRQAR